MKVIITHGKRRYEVVPCGRRCQYSKPYVDALGNNEVCADGCGCPEWWRRILITERGAWDGKWLGLREVKEKEK